MTKVLLTGASGFVGSHVLRHLLANTDWQIVAPYTFRHKGLPQRIASSVCDHDDWTQRVDLLHWDLRTPADTMTLRRLQGADIVMNVASESHVDRSISEPGPFIRNNVDVMLNVLETARKLGSGLVLQMSTDEVYGPAAGTYAHIEWDSIIPSNPYSASKAAQEAIAISYWRTYGVPVVITNTMNIVGEMQDPEKFVPMIIRNLRDRRPITVHTSPEGVPGSRYYLHARNLADAWLFLARRFEGVGNVPRYPDADRPARFHIVGEQEIDNIRMVVIIGHIMGLDADETLSLVQPVSFHASRPGHDLRYALDGEKIAALGWRAPVNMDEAMQRTVAWTLKNPEWLEL
jgi:dTDP-glucose 4,6-dehydratase